MITRIASQSTERIAQVHPAYRTSGAGDGRPTGHMGSAAPPRLAAAVARSVSGRTRVAAGCPYALTAGGNMSSHDRDVHLGAEMDLALSRALEAAKLQAGDATATSTAFVGHSEPSSVEADGDAGAADGE